MSENKYKAFRQQIFQDVDAERDRQVEVKGYTPDHDAFHTPSEMVRISNWQYTLPNTMKARRAGLWYSRQNFIRAIAVLVAAVEVMDARAERSKNPS